MKVYFSFLGESTWNWCWIEALELHILEYRTFWEVILSNLLLLVIIDDYFVN
jgi:hypothetical protein